MAEGAKDWSEMSDGQKKVEVARMNVEVERDLLRAKATLLKKITEDSESGKGTNATYLAEAYALINGTLNSYTPTAG